MTARSHTVLFDFDGTISLGSGPVLAYARAAGKAMPDAERKGFLDRILTGLSAHPTGRVPGTDAIDGYDFVRILSAEYGVAPSSLSAAYLSSRAQLATELAPISAPVGLADFLASIADRANLVVATNAPETRLDEALAELGLSGVFDVRYTSVGKPSGLDAVLDDWMPHGPLLSVGDVWANDLAPAQARGAATAYIGPAAELLTAQPTFRAEALPQLYPAIASWLHDFPLPHDSLRIPTATTER
jgi:phosphoglycolate phosphatase-like HAD superfamily hydrolase